jgi:flagellar basal-body rod protein FlgB
MLDRMMKSFDFHADALRLRSERQALLASNIANADTPNYKARDFNFSATLAQLRSTHALANSHSAPGIQVKNSLGKDELNLQRSSATHFGIGVDRVNSPSRGNQASTEARYRHAEQAAADGNTVDMDRERASFLDNSLRYESTLRFMNSNLRQMMSAIKGD